MAAENGSRLGFAVDGHPVSGVSTVSLVTDNTGGYAGQTTNAATSVNLDSIHTLPLYSSTYFSKRTGVAL
jgi:hypothetical protein